MIIFFPLLNRFIDKSPTQKPVSGNFHKGYLFFAFDQ
jgi:hypothetical protein